MYEASLLAMEYFLNEVGEEHWLKWIRTDLEAWRSTKSTSHHFSAYGGMGSFNDVVINHKNIHSISAGTESTETWADVIFTWLKSLCYFCAKNPNKEYTLSELTKQIGSQDPALSAFIGGENAPDEMRGQCESNHPIQGWRCLECGYGEISESDIHYYLARTIVPIKLLQACTSNILIPTIKNLLNGTIDKSSPLFLGVKQSITQADIKIINRDGWMRPCPSCNSDDTVVYRWHHSKDGLVAGEDNLPIKSEA